MISSFECVRNGNHDHPDSECENTKEYYKSVAEQRSSEKKHLPRIKNNYPDKFDLPPAHRHFRKYE
ncbi:MAG: hypothetical protein WCF90_02875 [Methanomicrobiales archaeon]